MEKKTQKLRNHKAVHRYDDMINMAHHVSKVHPHMPIQDRAAQFAPFAALTGHHEAVKETGRLTRERVELDENYEAVLDGKIQYICQHLDREPLVSITYFVPDLKKPGGSYETITGCVKKIDAYRRILILTDKTNIPIEEIIDIAEIEGEYTV